MVSKEDGLITKGRHFFRDVKPAVSRRMAAIHSTGNKSTEMKIIQLLKRNHLVGWRRHASLYGKPDFVWKIYRVALFVDGCFWHGCPYCKKLPVNYDPYWISRIERNKTRDRSVTRILRKTDWTVVRIWECRLRSSTTVRHIKNALRAQ